ncbi:MAG: penicillin-binding protein [Actinomycetota bacterium]|nr:penicillin-binding protein [Actinomycetota bacterium]
MNAPLRRLALAVMILFGLLLLNVNYLQVVRANSLHNDPTNPRVIFEEYSRQRGPILVGGRPVANSVATKDRLKYKRGYPLGPMYAPATGFYSLIYGASGIESEENSILAGTDDSLFVRRVIDQLTGEQVRGGSVQLTLNARAQKAAYDGLHGRKGAVVAIDPSTGAILALVTSPSYDPTVLSSHDTQAVRKAYERLNKDPNKPMLDRALRQTYAPGSTFKLVTAAAALESGRFQRDTPVFNGPRLDLPQTTVSLPNFDNRPCNLFGKTATLEDALRRSCNAAFGKVGLDLGAVALRRQAEKFGMNTVADTPIPSVRSRFPATLDQPHTAQSAIGQFDVRATPLQMAMVVAAIANRGVLMKPFLVQEVRGPDLSVLSRTRPREFSTAMSPRTADTLGQMMVTVVEKGTGTNAQISGVQVAGKTGTAQQGDGRKPHAWFVSFAPVNDPKVAVAVVLEDGGGAAEVSGNKLAAPIAKAVMLAVLGR